MAVHRRAPTCIAFTLRGPGRAILLAAVLLSAAVSAQDLRTVTPVIDVASRVAALRKLPHEERLAYCSNEYLPAQPARRVTMSGPIDRAHSNSQSFLNALYAQISAYFHSPADHYALLRQTLLDAAGLQAFTELAPYSPAEYPGYNPWNEPAYQQALLLVPVALGYLIVQHEEPAGAELPAVVKRWGDAILDASLGANDDFADRFGGADRASLKASGYAFWGNATNHRQALTRALDGYRTVLKTIGGSGADRRWGAKGNSRLYYANMTWGPLALTAYALVRSGVANAYEMTSFLGGTVDQAASWLVREMKQEGNPILTTNRAPGSRGAAWLEPLLADRAASAQLSAEARQALDDLVPPRYIAFAGGPVTCLFRQLP